MRNLFALVVVFVISYAQVGFSQVDNNDVPDGFRLIHGGRFIQGMTGGERALQQSFPLSTTGQNYGNAEGPAHVTWVTQPFLLSETEVTVGQFRVFVQATGYKTSAEQPGTEMVGWDPTPADKPLYQSHDFWRDSKFTWKDPGFEQTDNHPVVGVSFVDAKAYCQWLSKRDGAQYRLPTEAEWELACRAGTSTWFSFGDRAKEVAHLHGNFGNVELERHRKHAAERQWLLDWENDPNDGHVFTAPVANYAANPWGIHDMHGNVWEWTEDLWLDTVYKDFTRPRYDQPTGTAVDPVNLDRPQTDANDFHTIRGGCWYNGDLPCRSSSRTCWDARDAACYVGFRIVREVSPEHSTQARDLYEREQQAIEAIRAAGGKIHSSRGIDIEVRLEGDVVDESVFQRLAELPDLKRLGVRWRSRDVGLSQSGLDAISKLVNLEELEFQRGLGVEALSLSCLCNLTNLNVLRFPREAPLNNAHLEALGEFESLVEFRCYGTAGGLTDEGIAQLSANRNLETVSIWENDATGEFLKTFVGCPLKSLVCTANSQHAGTMVDGHASGMADFPGLRKLTLEGQRKLTGETLVVIAGLGELRELSLEHCTGVLDRDFSVLSELTHLRQINLLGSQAGDAAAEAISRIPRISVVRIGDVEDQSRATLSDSGVASLSHAFSITELRLDSDRITDQGVESIGRINRLKQLTISSGNVTGAGLGPLTRLPELFDLSLRTSGLRDIAFDHLANAKSVSKIRLAHNGIKPPAALTDEGALKMSEATWVRELWLPRNGTAMSETTIEVLGEKLPKTNVIPYTVHWENE